MFDSIHPAPRSKPLDGYGFPIFLICLVDWTISNMHAKYRERGFTLLEVLVATTIVGLVFGGVFSAIVASKQLSIRTKHAFDRSTEIRMLGSAVALYLALGQKPSSDLLTEGRLLEFEKLTVKYDDEENLQSGQLEHFSISGESVAPITGIVWISQADKR